VLITSTATDADSAQGLQEARLNEFRAKLSELLKQTGEGDQITARWQPNNSYAAGTISREHEFDELRSTLITV